MPERPRPNEESPLPAPPVTLRPFVLAAGLIFATIFLDLALERLERPATAGIRVLWSLSMLGFGWLRVHKSPLPRGVRKGFIVLNVTACAALAHLTGGTESAAFYGLILLPLLMTPFIRGQMDAAAVNAVATFFGGMTVVWLHEPEELPQAFFMFAAIGGAVIQAGWMYRTNAHTLQATELQRREAIEREWQYERERHEASLRQAHFERLAAMGRMAAAVAHEVNNPLAYVRANLNYLRTEVLEHVKEEEIRKELGEVISETIDGLERIKQIGADLRDVAREQSEAPESVALAPLLEQAIRIVRLRIGPKVRVSLLDEGELPRIFVPPGRLTQVLINLLANAGDALATSAAPEIRITPRVTGDFLSIAIEDNGPGLPENWRKRLFQPFFTTKPAGEGTGLGLSLSRHYVASFGGALTAEEREGGGARFIVAVPVAPLPSADGPTKPLNSSVPDSRV